MRMRHAVGQRVLEMSVVWSLVAKEKDTAQGKVTTSIQSVQQIVASSWPTPSLSLTFETTPKRVQAL